MQYDLLVFETEDHNPFRTIEIDGAPWFVLGDVCRPLELREKNGSFWHVAEQLDEDEKQTVPRDVVERATSPLKGEVSRRAAPHTIVINESGLYSLMLRSRKPEAKRFKKWVTSEVLPSIRRTGAYRIAGKTPAFIRRFNDNWDRVTPGYFSVLSELAIRLHGRLEMVGHIMADRAPNGKENRPDVSVGQLFADHLREKHPEHADKFAYYWHKTPECECEARQYLMELLPLYIEFIDNIWIPQHSERYFRTRDPAALPYLPKLLPLAQSAKPALPRRMGQPARPRFMARIPAATPIRAVAQAPATNLK
jgi:prophage antirepressor-like protein